VWAGMRGVVVTLAASQTIPRTVDDRPIFIYIAFLVALVSLMLQGFTLPWLVKRLKLDEIPDSNDIPEQERLDAELRGAAASALADPDLHRRDGTPFDPAMLERVAQRYTQPASEETSVVARDMLELRLATIDAMRTRLLEVTSGGTFSTHALRHALAELDADQLSIELRLREDD